MKKVLQIRCSGQLLGAERVILELAKQLPAKGYQPIIGIPVEQGEPEPEIVSAARELGYEVVVFPIKGAFDLSALGRIKEYVVKNDISIVHSHGYREDLYALRCKSVAKLVATNHLWKRRDWKLKLYAKLDAFLLKFFDHVVGVSKPVIEDMVSEGLVASGMTLVPNGIDTEKYKQSKNRTSLRQEFGLGEDAVVLATLSSLTVEKGIDVAIEALAGINGQSKKLTLLIVGDGPEREKLAQLVESYGLGESVIFAGRRKDVADILAAVDLFLLPSFVEGLPMALLEAMASGCAVIATSVGDVPDVVDSEVGKLIPPRDIQSLKSALTEMLYDPEQLKHYGNVAQARIEQSFSSAAMADGYAKVYDQVMHSK